MPISRDEATALAELITVVRPAWDARGVMSRGLGPLAKHPAPLEVIAWAALRAAADPDCRTPAAIPLNGRHWDLAARPETPRLTPEHECPRHPGQWAGNCSPCRSEELAGPDDTESAPVLSTKNAQERARDAARRARRVLTDQTPTPKPAGPQNAESEVGTNEGEQDDPGPPWDTNGPHVAAHRGPDDNPYRAGPLYATGPGGRFTSRDISHNKVREAMEKCGAERRAAEARTGHR